MIDVVEFEQKLPALQEKLPERRALEQTQQKSAPEAPIRQGERNGTLTSLAGSMRRRGMSERAILAALLEENRRRCSPPLEDAEVEQIAASVAKYSPSNSENAAGTAKKGKSESQATRLVHLAKKV